MNKKGEMHADGKFVIEKKARCTFKIFVRFDSYQKQK